jgi:hypothetical protein
MLRFTDAFIWEDLPLTVPDTGSVTMVAWMPRIRKMTTLIWTVALIYYAIQNAVRFSTSNDHVMIYETWYPFDTTESPVYELVILAQVSVCSGIPIYPVRYIS